MSTATTPAIRPPGGLRHALRAALALRSLAALGIAVLAHGALAPAAAAQGGGFTANDIFIYNAAAQGIGAQSGAIVRLNPVSGAAALYVDLFTSQQQPGAAVFDPYRQRLVFSASINTMLEPVKLWFADGAGLTQDSGLGTNLSFHSMAPTGDGRIYLRDAGGGASPFKWVDAAGVLHVLLDSTGTVPFLIDNLSTYNVQGMIYDAGANALFAASSNPCPGGTNGHIFVRKLPLSADGTRVVGPVGCSEFAVGSGGVTPGGWSRMSGGMLLLGVDNNENSASPRMLAVDPVTLGISAFASNGPYTGAAATNAACWLDALGKAAIMDTFADELRAYGAGETGAGTPIVPSFPIGTNGSSGETPAMFEIPASACSGGWIAYGKGLAGAGAFVPTLTGGGCPEPGSAFTLKMGSVVGGANGAMFLGVAPAALPFKGGTLNVNPVLLTFNLTVGGAAGVGGAGSLNLPAALPPNPGLTGLSVFLQTAWSDNAAVQKVSLSNGLELEIG